MPAIHSHFPVLNHSRRRKLKVELQCSMDFKGTSTTNGQIHVCSFNENPIFPQTHQLCSKINSPLFYICFLLSPSPLTGSIGYILRWVSISDGQSKSMCCSWKKVLEFKCSTSNEQSISQLRFSRNNLKLCYILSFSNSDVAEIQIKFWTGCLF